jgi:hypothetical protein
MGLSNADFCDRVVFIKAASQVRIETLVQIERDAPLLTGTVPPTNRWTRAAGSVSPRQKEKGKGKKNSRRRANSTVRRSMRNH